MVTKKAAQVESPQVESPQVRTIRVVNAYVGKPSKERWVLPGIYKEDDEKLFGLGEYLVEVIHDAVWHGID